MNPDLVVLFEMTEPKHLTKYLFKEATKVRFQYPKLLVIAGFSVLKLLNTEVAFRGIHGKTPVPESLFQ